jgi:hypothetical protein
MFNTAFSPVMYRINAANDLNFICQPFDPDVFWRLMVCPGLVPPTTGTRPPTRMLARAASPCTGGITVALETIRPGYPPGIVSKHSADTELLPITDVHTSEDYCRNHLPLDG